MQMKTDYGHVHKVPQWCKISLIHTLLIQPSQLSGICGLLGKGRAKIHFCAISKNKVELNKYKGQAAIKSHWGSP